MATHPSLSLAPWSTLNTGMGSGHPPGMLERQRPIEALQQEHSTLLSPQQSAFVLPLGGCSWVLGALPGRAPAPTLPKGKREKRGAEEKG